MKKGGKLETLGKLEAYALIIVVTFDDGVHDHRHHVRRWRQDDSEKVMRRVAVVVGNSRSWDGSSIERYDAQML